MDYLEVTPDQAESVAQSDLEDRRIGLYESQDGMFLVHSWRPSDKPDQAAEIRIELRQHGDGPLTRGEIESVEYAIGDRFLPGGTVLMRNFAENFRLDVSAYGPFACLARVNQEGPKPPTLLSRYVDFEIDRLDPGDSDEG